jgi:phage tail-like protein
MARAGFSKVAGISANVQIIEYREGGDTDTPQKSTGLVSFDNITLSRGQVVGSGRGGDQELYQWFQTVFSVGSTGTSTQYRKDLDVVQYNTVNEEVARWRIINAIPAKFKPFSDLDAVGNENAIEEIELSHEGFFPVN